MSDPSVDSAFAPPERGGVRTYVHCVYDRGAARAATRQVAQPGREVYSKPTWWDARFEADDGSFDWYATYSELEALFQEFCPPASELESLMVGCGNSELSAQMCEKGYKRIVNVDISGAAVAKMEARFGSLGLEWLEMDATDMRFEDGRFGLAVDKGTVDAMMCGADSTLASALSAEVWRTLRPGGLLVVISHSPARQAMLDEGVRARHGPSAAWELLELRKCRLSPQATFINMLRSMLGDRPLADAFKDPELLTKAITETKKTLKQMAFLDVFRMFKARKAQQSGGASLAAIAAGAASKAASDQVSDSEGDDHEGGAVASRRSKRQSFCWAYVLRKAMLDSAVDA